MYACMNLPLLGDIAAHTCIAYAFVCKQCVYACMHLPLYGVPTCIVYACVYKNSVYVCMYACMHLPLLDHIGVPTSLENLLLT